MDMCAYFSDPDKHVLGYSVGNLFHSFVPLLPLASCLLPLLLLASCVLPVASLASLAILASRRTYHDDESDEIVDDDNDGDDDGGNDYLPSFTSTPYTDGLPAGSGLDIDHISGMFFGQPNINDYDVQQPINVNIIASDGACNILVTLLQHSCNTPLNIIASDGTLLHHSCNTLVTLL
jgi:hypothetical protein